MSRKKNIISDYPVFASNFSRIVEDNGGKDIFANKIGSTYDSVRRWCNGESLPGGPALQKIYEIYGISIDWLLTGKNKIKCSYCGDWPNSIRDACTAVKKILESDDKAVRTALSSNLAAFKQSIEKNKKLRKARPKDKINPGKRARDKSMGSQSDTGTAAKSAVG